MATQIKLRRDTASNWSQANPVLALGEPGYDTNANKLKIGNGVTRWNSLPYLTNNTTSYNDLLDKPTIPSDINQLTDADNLLGQGSLNINDFGDGFSLSAGKIVTRKLYSTNNTNPNQHYRLELDNNGVVHLPDQSIINGATLRVVPGTGELNYAALAAGPSTDQPENTWMWVDHTGAYVGTDYSGASHTWAFGNDGTFNLPVIPNDAAYIQATSHIKVNANSATWSFATDGNITLPAGGDIKDVNGSSVLGAGDQLTRRTNSTVTSSSVVWTSLQNYVSGAKLIIQVECDEQGDESGWHSQVCEAIISSRGYANGFSGPGGDPQMTVYGVVHTSVDPLMTFSVQRNPTTKSIEVVGTLTPAAASTAYLRIHSVELTTRD